MEQARKGKKIAYFYNSEIGKFTYGKDHPMKPKRVQMAHNLIVNLGLYRELDVYTTRSATDQELLQFHMPEYIKYLGTYVSSNLKKLFEEEGLNSFKEIKEPRQTDGRNFNIQDTYTKSNFKVGETSDCPGFDGLYNFCQLSAGGSIDSAHLIINNEADICVNWSGGLHHARKCEASGFCYVNDIVLCILELLKYYSRVIYIDIDVHHGDGVEEAFFLTNRVLTLSFHQYGEDFFPGSGSVDSIGDGPGKFHAVNVPLKPGMNDETFLPLFQNITRKVMEVYRPEVILMQCGADSLAYDKLGGFNLSTKGHGACVEFMHKFNIPMVIVGGGGYNVPNVARCWAYEISVILDKKMDLQTTIPSIEPFYDYYAPDHKLHVNPKQNCENKNSKEDLHKLEVRIYEMMKNIEQAPSIPFHYVPESFLYDESDVEMIDEENSYNQDQFQQILQPEVSRRPPKQIHKGVNI